MRRRRVCWPVNLGLQCFRMFVRYYHDLFQDKDSSPSAVKGRKSAGRRNGTVDGPESISWQRRMVAWNYISSGEALFCCSVLLRKLPKQAAGEWSRRRVCSAGWRESSKSSRPAPPSLQFGLARTTRLAGEVRSNQEGSKISVCGMWGCRSTEDF